MTDDQLRQLLQSALPPIAAEADPKDAWLAIDARLDSRPAWTPVDLVLVTGVILGLALVPDALLLIALHL
jgi:hypothetical protein